MSEKAYKIEIYRLENNRRFFNIFVGGERIAEYVSDRWSTRIVNALNAVKTAKLKP
jgi:hypothetical protein